jgi:hypothetical protein
LRSIFRRHVDAKLVGRSWDRSASIERVRWEQRETTSHPPTGARNIQTHRDPYTVDRPEWRTEVQYVNGEAQTVRRQVIRQEIK